MKNNRHNRYDRNNNPIDAQGNVNLIYTLINNSSVINKYDARTPAEIQKKNIKLIIQVRLLTNR